MLQKFVDVTPSWTVAATTAVDTVWTPINQSTTDAEIEDLVRAAQFSLPEATYSRATGSAISFTHHEGSRNWSGAYITPRDGLMFTDVFAFWTVPTVMAPPVGPPGGTYGSLTGSAWTASEGTSTRPCRNWARRNS